MAGTIIGARLGHVFFYEWDYYSANPGEIIKVWNGGLASHGGTIGVILGVLFYSMFTTKRSPLWAFDRLVIPIALVGAMIRFGNLMNSEIYGGSDRSSVGNVVRALARMAHALRGDSMSPHADL